MDVEDVEQFFSLEVFVHNITLFVPCDIPAISFRLLNYPLIVIYHDNIHKYVFEGDRTERNSNITRTFTFNKGKSCLFKTSSKLILPLLVNSPLLLNLLDVYIPSSVKLLAAFNIPLYETMLAVCSNNVNSEVTGIKDTYNLCDLVDNKIGTAEISCRIGRVGPPFQTHIDALMSSTASKRPPVHSPTTSARIPTSPTSPVPTSPTRGSPRTRAHNASTGRPTLVPTSPPVRKSKLEDEMIWKEEFHPPAMFYDSRSPQRNESPTKHNFMEQPLPYSPNIYIEPPNINHEYLVPSPPMRRAKNRSVPSITNDTQTMIETMAAEFLRYLQLRRGQIPALFSQHSPPPSPPSHPPHPHSPHSPPIHTNVPPPPESSDLGDTFEDSMGGNSHARCKEPTIHKQFKASPPPSRRPTSKKGPRKESGIATQTSFKDLPSQQPFANYLPIPRGLDYDPNRFTEETTSTYTTLPQPPQPQQQPQPPSNPQQTNIPRPSARGISQKDTSLQPGTAGIHPNLQHIRHVESPLDTSLHTDPGLQLEASLQSITSLIATLPREPQELSKQMEQLESLQQQLRELQLHAQQKSAASQPQKSSSNKAIQKAPSNKSIQKSPSNKAIQKTPSTKSVQQNLPKSNSQKSIQKAPSNKSVQLTIQNLPKSNSQKAIQKSPSQKSVHLAPQKSSSNKSVDSHQGRKSPLQNYSDDDFESDTETKDVGKKGGKKDESDELGEMYSDFFESEDEHNASSEKKKAEKDNAESDRWTADELNSTLDKTGSGKWSSGDEMSKDKGKGGKESDYEDSLRSGFSTRESFASSAEIDKIVSKYGKAKQRDDDEIEEDIVEDEVLEDVDEEIEDY